MNEPENIFENFKNFEETKKVPMLEKIEETVPLCEEIKNKNENFSKNVFSKIEKTDKLNSMAGYTKLPVIKKTNNFVKEKDYRVIGQFADSYILVERKGILEIYDQHIVHERILYEKFKKEYHEKQISTQNLLVPIKINISNKDREIVETHQETLRKFGFEIDFFGKNDILVRAVPNIKFSSSIENLVREIIEDLKNIKIKNSLIEEIIITASCKNAVKANEKLTNEEIEILLEKLYEVDEYTCPHGRPIILKLSLDDVEKGFKRK